MIRKYDVELDGQRDFYENYLKRIDKTLSIDDVLINNTDGIINGNILEFKLKINDINSVLFQTIKYLSSMRIQGKSIPKNIILISLNDGLAYVYDSGDYFDEIHKVYSGGSSKENTGFIANDYLKRLEYVEKGLDEEELIKLLKENHYTKINIDENCIVGWAERFYKENPSAKKSDFIGDLEGKVKIVGEIRQPNKFKDYINQYEGSNNVKFQYLMDKLNDTMQKKNLGAFYTPELYVKKALELVREAIKRVPCGNDYIILDRCAGTGNLEKLMTEEELLHCVLSTIEYYEYKVLLELLGDKVRHIVPPTEKEDSFNMGLVRGADALSEEYINNPIIKQYINNPNCTIIMFENPPYSETTSIEHQKKGKGKQNSVWKNSYVVKKMKEEVKGSVTNDLANAFIWSAFKYYLRQDTDSYVVFSPIKYWKSQHLINKKVIKGFGFNRKHFHTNTEAFVSCILWKNECDNIKEFTLKSFDIKDSELVECEDAQIKKVHTLLSKFYDKEKYDDTVGIAGDLLGREVDKNRKVRLKPKYNEDIVCYVVAMQSGFDNPDLNSGLTTIGRYDSNGSYIRKNNLLHTLPIFSATRYIKYDRDWLSRGRIMKSADKYSEYLKDVQDGKLKDFLLKNLLFICFEPQNHMRSLNGSDGRFYRNELCLDTTNGETIASNCLKDLSYNEDEKNLIKVWKQILEQAKKTKEYNKEFTYGLYQIDEELNTDYKDEKNKTVYNYPELNGHIKTLKALLKNYYLNEIVPVLFEYEFLK